MAFTMHHMTEFSARGNVTLSISLQAVHVDVTSRLRAINITKVTARAPACRLGALGVISGKQNYKHCILSSHILTIHGCALSPLLGLG